MRFLIRLNFFLFIIFSSAIYAGESINLQLQNLKQQSLLLDRDLLILQEKVEQPFEIYLSLNTDINFQLEKLIIKLDGKEFVSHEYSNVQRKALAQDTAQLVYKGKLNEGEHKIIAYYRSDRGYKNGTVYTFKRKAATQAIEIIIHKAEYKQSRVQPQVKIVSIQDSDSPISVNYRHFKYLNMIFPDKDILSQVMKSQKLNKLGKYAIQAELLKGRLYLDRGLHIEAEKIFQKIIGKNNVPDKIKNEATFYLGKSFYKQDEQEKALLFFNKAGLVVNDDIRAEQQHLYSLILMSQGNYQQAVDYLRKTWWDAPGNWDLYIRINFGVALIRNGDEEAGVELIRSIGENKLISLEAQALVDKANQSLGYLLLNQKKFIQAREYLEKVKLNGPYSNLALLGAGWASANVHEYKRALVPWLELQKKDIRDDSVQESMLAIPYAFEKIGRLKKSIQYYEKAVQVYKKENNELVQSIESLKNDEFKKALSVLNVTSEKSWKRSVGEARKTNSLRYINQLIDDSIFFNLLLNYREAKMLENRTKTKIKIIQSIQRDLLNKAKISSAAIKNRDQISFIKILTSNLLDRSLNLKLKAQSNIDKIISEMRVVALKALQYKKNKINVYLVQSKLALAQSYDRL